MSRVVVLGLLCLFLGGMVSAQEGPEIAEFKPDSIPFYMTVIALFHEIPEDIKMQAEEKLPQKPVRYERDELLPIFKDVSHPDAYQYLTEALDILFGPAIGTPAHPNEHIIKGWQCLLKKFMAIDFCKNEGINEKDLSKVQIVAAQQLFQHHRASIMRVNPKFAETIPDKLQIDLGCKACLGIPAKL